jgi:serine/threonine protein kinase
MAVATVERKMLYCPKCNATYQDGTQRFCSNDGSRLVSGSTAKSTANSQGVFTSLLGRAASNSENDERIIAKTARPENKPPVFQTAFTAKVFKGEDLSLPAKDTNTIAEKPIQTIQTPIQTAPPVVRLIKPNEIASGTAEIGDRKTNPTGRLALTWENPKVLLGQTIKGRYYVIEKLDQDDSSIVYLAEDKIIADKQVVVRVLMEEKNDAFLSKIFSEERVSLSHLNHPSVVGVLDSGELLEGLPFIVSESVDGFSLKEKLSKLEQFNPLRTARIVRQASYALSEVHQNGILHRSLKPSSIFLTVSEVGTEQVKVADFVVSNGAKKQNMESVKYLSPEQIEGKMPNFASDIYSLAVIAYQMLTGAMPFDFASADQLLKAQRDGLYILPSKLRKEISPSVDEVFIKALAYHPTERYPKARDFGDALFSALSLSVNPENAVEIPGVELKEENKLHLPSTSILKPVSLENKTLEEANQIKIEAKKEEIKSETEVTKIAAPTGELAWEKRSPEPVQTVSPLWVLLGLIGIIALGFLAYQSWNYFKNRETPAEIIVANPTPATPASETPVTPISPEIESPPLPRSVKQPENSEFFENSKAEQKAKTELLKNYRGFKLYYPQGWVKNDTRTNFLDVSKLAENGTLMERWVITPYTSTGLFSKDKELFPKLVEKSNKDIASSLKDYKVLAQGEAKIQQGRWNVYEVKFQGTAFDSQRNPITVWGRRFWLPTQNPTMRNGFVITMLATSLSPEITGVDDVGNKGELPMILENFEPSTAD